MRAYACTLLVGAFQMADGSMRLASGLDFSRVVADLRQELGALNGILNEDDVLEVACNPDGGIYVERFLKGSRRELSWTTDERRRLIDAVAGSLDLHVGPGSPRLESKLLTHGSRFTAAIEPVVPAPMFVIRQHAKRIMTLSDYIAAGSLSQAQGELICSAVKNRQNVMISGGTSSGKTTFGNAVLDLIAELTPAHRVVTIEDVPELQCRVENRVELLTDSRSGTTIRALVEMSLRCTPDRVIVGEVRKGEAALEMLKAWNTGHPGGIATIHADDGLSTLYRLEELLREVMSEVPRAFLARAVNLVVCLHKTPEGRREVKEILQVQGVAQDGEFITSKVEV